MRRISVLAFAAALSAAALGHAAAQAAPDEPGSDAPKSAEPDSEGDATLETKPDGDEGKSPVRSKTPLALPLDTGAARIPDMTKDMLAERLNASNICAPLSIDINDVTSLLGLAIPSFLPIDPNVRWDQNAHSVEKLQSSDGTFEATIAIGCQPGSNGVVLEYLGLTPERLRLPGEAFCAGAIDREGRPVGADCTLEGRIVPYVGKTIDLEGRIERALTQLDEAVPGEKTE